MKGTESGQNYLEKKKSWRTHTSQFQNLIQSYNNQRQCGIGIRRDI